MSDMKSKVVQFKSGSYKSGLVTLVIDGKMDLFLGGVATHELKTIYDRIMESDGRAFIVAPVGKVTLPLKKALYLVQYMFKGLSVADVVTASTKAGAEDRIKARFIDESQDPVIVSVRRLDEVDGMKVKLKRKKGSNDD